MSDNQRALALAMVLLSTPESPDPAAIEAATRDAPDGLAPFERTESDDESLTFSSGNLMAFVSLIPVVIPDGEASIAAEASWHWPDAAAAVDKHTAHLLVAVMGGDDAVANHLALTRVVAGCLGENAVAVYWGAAGIVHDPEEFKEMAASAGREELPVPYWVGVTVAPSDEKEGAVVAATRGLEALGFPEFEVHASEHPPEEVAEFLMMSSAYVLDSGARLSSGDTIGRTKKEQIAVTLAPSKWEPDRQALILAF